MKVHLTMVSANEKTGPIPVSTTSRESCAPGCPFYENGCYAERGPLWLHWQKVTAGERGLDWDQFCHVVEGAIAPDEMWRHDQAGDLPHDKGKIDRPKVRKLTRANRGKRGFTFTHHDMALAHNRAVVAEANRGGFVINLSANGTAHADQLCELEIAPVTTVLPSSVNGAVTPVVYTPKGRPVTVCPATYRDDISCGGGNGKKRCGICAAAQHSIVGFPAHGTNARKASNIAEGK